MEKIPGLESDFNGVVLHSEREDGGADVVHGSAFSYISDEFITPEEQVCFALQFEAFSKCFEKEMFQVQRVGRRVCVTFHSKTFATVEHADEWFRYEIVEALYTARYEAFDSSLPDWLRCMPDYFGDFPFLERTITFLDVFHMSEMLQDTTKGDFLLFKTAALELVKKVEACCYAPTRWVGFDQLWDDIG